MSVIACLFAVLILGVGLIFGTLLYRANEAAPVAELPRPPNPIPSPDPQDNPLQLLPAFPWPPPAASASYVLPRSLFKEQSTIGQASDAIISALERNGYVERSFFRTEPGGAALVTRVERITDDGSHASGAERWPSGWQSRGSALDLGRFLKALFYVDSGRYRVIVFVIQRLPFSQSASKVTGDEARGWLLAGANALPPEAAALAFLDCTALIYEFASDGQVVRVVESPLTGRQHLEKAGILAALETKN